jgi:hypothetical protein
MEYTISNSNSITGFSKLYYAYFDETANTLLKIKRGEKGDIIDIFTNIVWRQFDFTSLEVKTATTFGLLSKGLNEGEVLIKRNVLNVEELIELDKLKSKFFIWLLVSESNSYIVSVKSKILPFYSLKTEENLTFELKMKTDISLISEDYVKRINIEEGENSPQIDYCKLGLTDVLKLAITKYKPHTPIYDDSGFLKDLFPFDGISIEKNDWMGIIPYATTYDVNISKGGVRQSLNVKMSKSLFTQDIVNNVSQEKWIVVLYTSSDQLIMLRECTIDQVSTNQNDGDNTLSFNFIQEGNKIDYLISYYPEGALPYISSDLYDCCEGFYGVKTNDTIVTIQDIWNCFLINFF